MSLITKFPCLGNSTKIEPSYDDLRQKSQNADKYLALTEIGFQETTKTCFSLDQLISSINNLQSEWNQSSDMSLEAFKNSFSKISREVSREINKIKYSTAVLDLIHIGISSRSFDANVNNSPIPGFKEHIKANVDALNNSLSELEDSYVTLRKKASDREDYQKKFFPIQHRSTPLVPLSKMTHLFQKNQSPFAFPLTPFHAPLPKPRSDEEIERERQEEIQKQNQIKLESKQANKKFEKELKKELKKDNKYFSNLDEQLSAERAFEKRLQRALTKEEKQNQTSSSTASKKTPSAKKSKAKEAPQPLRRSKRLQEKNSNKTSASASKKTPPAKKSKAKEAPQPLRRSKRLQEKALSNAK